MSAEMSMTGMEELIKKLYKLNGRAEQVEDKAIRAGAKVIQQKASELAPRDPNSSDHIADNIIISSVKQVGGVKTVTVGPQRGDKGRYFRGKFLEWGTSKMSAQPFMGPAAATSKREVTEAIKNELQKGLKL